MKTYAIELADRATIPVVGRHDYFPVNRIFCVGRNYAQHALEMGGNPKDEPPFFFTKPADSIIVGEQASLPYPPRTEELHHEVEMVVGLKSGGFAIPADSAVDCIFGAAVAIEFTRRDLQRLAKEAGRPWEMGKGFDGSAAIGAMTPVNRASLPKRGKIWLDVNGTTRQSGDLSEMIWSVGETIAELSTYLTLRAGDLIFTGTPEGVGSLVPGDRMQANCEGLQVLEVLITSPEGN